MADPVPETPGGGYKYGMAALRMATMPDDAFEEQWAQPRDVHGDPLDGDYAPMHWNFSCEDHPYGFGQVHVHTRSADITPGDSLLPYAYTSRPSKEDWDAYAECLNNKRKGSAKSRDRGGIKGSKGTPFGQRSGQFGGRPLGSSPSGGLDTGSLQGSHPVRGGRLQGGTGLQAGYLSSPQRLGGGSLQPSTGLSGGGIQGAGGLSLAPVQGAAGVSAPSEVQTSGGLGSQRLSAGGRFTPAPVQGSNGGLSRGSGLNAPPVKGTPISSGSTNGSPISTGDSHGTSFGGRGITGGTQFGANSGETRGTSFGDRVGEFNGKPFGSRSGVFPSTDFEGKRNPVSHRKPISNGGAHVQVTNDDGTPSNTGGASLSRPESTRRGHVIPLPYPGGKSWGGVVAPSAEGDMRPSDKRNTDEQCDNTRYLNYTETGVARYYDTETTATIGDVWQYSLYNSGGSLGWNKERTGAINTVSVTAKPVRCHPPNGPVSATTYYSYGTVSGRIVRLNANPLTRAILDAAWSTWKAAPDALKGIWVGRDYYYALVAWADDGNGFPSLDRREWRVVIPEGTSSRIRETLQTPGIKVDVDLVTRKCERTGWLGSGSEGFHEVSLTDLIPATQKYRDLNEDVFGTGNAWDGYPMKLRHMMDYGFDTMLDMYGSIQDANEFYATMIKLRYVSLDGRKYRVTTKPGAVEEVHTMVADAQWGYATPESTTGYPSWSVTKIEVWDGTGWVEHPHEAGYDDHDQAAWGLGIYGNLRHGAPWGFTVLNGDPDDHSRYRTRTTHIKYGQSGTAEKVPKCTEPLAHSYEWRKVEHYYTTAYPPSVTEHTVTEKLGGVDISPNADRVSLQPDGVPPGFSTAFTGGIDTATVRRSVSDPAISEGANYGNVHTHEDGREYSPDPYGKEVSRSTVSLTLTYGDSPLYTGSGTPPKVYFSPVQDAPNPAHGQAVYVEHPRYCPA